MNRFNWLFTNECALPVRYQCYSGVTFNYLQSDPLRRQNSSESGEINEVQEKHLLGFSYDGNFDGF